MHLVDRFAQAKLDQQWEKPNEDRGTEYILTDIHIRSAVLRILNRDP